MAPDPVAAYLSEVERRCAYVKASARSGLGADEAARNSADDVPRLLAAVNKALAYHTPTGAFPEGEVCAGHGDDMIAGSPRWPCDEYKTVTGELLAEEDADA